MPPGGRGTLCCDASCWRETVRRSVEERTSAQADGTDLTAAHRTAGLGQHHEVTDIAGRWMNGRTVERPGAHRRALFGAEERSTRAHREVWQNHPHDASDHTGRRAGRPDLRDRRQGEVGEDIQVAPRCPAVIGPSGGRVSDAGWCRRPLRCRRRNTAVDEQSAKVVVIPLRWRSG